MKRNKPTHFIAGLFAAIFSPTLNAQQAPAQNEDEIVRLSPFEVSSSAPARYQAAEAAAGGRIAANIMDTPTTVTVLTRDFLNDVGGVRVLDVAKYVAGVSDSTNPNAIDTNSDSWFLHNWPSSGWFLDIRLRELRLRGD